MSEKRVNIELKDDLHRQAKAIAVLKGVSLAKFVQDAIADSITSDSGLLADIARPLRKKDNSSTSKEARK
ncbi:MAG: hypothetical protein QS98_C0009G0017 [archaeon GW2011_AR3]|nr:MAG: hypothetical protein QS98_C0009G0017 [archaeon GW2011_AR3]MBS3110321.1 hypothetical protein [Candidatus Woesearchaeota archaeon]